MTILRQVANGDFAWFDVLSERYSRRLYNYLFSRVRNEHTAEELCQDVLLAAFRAARQDQFDGQHCDLSRWLFTIARNRLIDHQRRQNRRPVTLNGDSNHDMASQPSRELSPDDRAMRHEQAMHAHDLIAQLPDNQQEVVRLKVFGDLTFAAIAQMLDCPEGTVKTRMRSALAWIRDAVASREAKR